MIFRASIYAACLIAIGASLGHAQAPAPGPNSAPTDTPSIEPTAKTPNTTTAPIPDVVKPVAQHGDVIQPKSSGDPAAVLTPPNVDPNMTVGRAPAPGGNPSASAK